MFEFSISGSGTEQNRGRPVSSGGDPVPWTPCRRAGGGGVGSRCRLAVSARGVGSRCRLRRRGLERERVVVDEADHCRLASCHVRGAGEGPKVIDSFEGHPSPSPNPENRIKKRGPWHRAQGCERGVRVSLVSLHAPVTGRPAFSRGLWCFRRPAGAVRGAARVAQAEQRFERRGSNTASHDVQPGCNAADQVKAAQPPSRARARRVPMTNPTQ